MAQTFEFPMWSPHEKAKLYKRYTGELPVELKNNETMTIQENCYVYSGKLTWIEATSKEKTDEQPLEGLNIENEYLTIKTNSLKQIASGDIIELPKTSPFAGLWIVESGQTSETIYTPKPVQTFQFLPLSSLG